MYTILRSLLFKLDAEQAHRLALTALNLTPAFCLKQAQGQPVKAMGLVFPNPVGLAAGLDKNGNYLRGLAKLGFAFIELGTVTPRAQEGNPKPRLFRLPEAQALINRLGFNNQGVESLLAQVNKANYQGILGINIGKNKETPLAKAVADYLYCLGQVYTKASYVTLNLSSPNTPELRLLQQEDYLRDFLAALESEQKKLEDRHQRHVPLVLKVSPDESEETLKKMAELALAHGIEGIIATNTTATRPGLAHLTLSQEAGGLSGKPLHDLSTRCLRLLKSYVGNSLTLIGVGGVDSCFTAQEKLDAGASLVQIYSGLIYKGPGLVPRLVSGLSV